MHGWDTRRVAEGALDLALGLWMAVVVAQHLGLVAGALLGDAALRARIDLRAGYCLLGPVLVVGAVTRCCLDRSGD